MTTASAATAYAGLDLTASTRPSMATLVKVEIRKMVDTRAGMWLMITIAAVTVVATTIFGLAGHDRDLEPAGLAGLAEGAVDPRAGVEHGRTGPLPVVGADRGVNVGLGAEREGAAQEVVDVDVRADLAEDSVQKRHWAVLSLPASR